MITGILHGKNDFGEKSKNLATDLKIILLNYQNNCVEYVNIKIFCSIAHHFWASYIIILIIQQNYFHLLDMSLIKFLANNKLIDQYVKKYM